MIFSILFTALSLAIFGVLARFWPCNPGQPRYFGKDFKVDLTYFLIALLVYGNLSLALIKGALTLAGGADEPRLFAAVEAGYGRLSHLPVAVQALLIVFLVDVMQYWLHRAFHTRPLWPFHAVHHSAEEVDWTTTFRNHPVNAVVYTVGVGVLVKLMGFSPLAFVIVAVFNFFSAAMVHANLNWTFGPLKYVFASPVFHRWHHSSDPEVRDKNFAPTFAFLDLMFGTFHMPEGRLPDDYGAREVPQDFIGQLIHPFRAIAAAARRRPGPAGPEATLRP